MSVGGGGAVIRINDMVLELDCFSQVWCIMLADDTQNGMKRSLHHC